MSSILLHGLTNVSKEELIILFENKFKEVEILDIDISLKFESAIIYFENKASANEILAKFTEIEFSKKFGVYSLKISKEKYDESKINQLSDDKTISSHWANQPTQLSSNISLNSNHSSIISSKSVDYNNQLPCTSHDSSKIRLENKHNDLNQISEPYNNSNRINHNPNNCQYLNNNLNNDNMDAKRSSILNSDHCLRPINATTADQSFGECNNYNYELANEKTSKPEPMETEDEDCWEEYDNKNTIHNLPDLNGDRWHTASECNRFKRTIKLTKNKMNIEAKCYLINQMIACGGKGIKEGFEFKVNNDLVEILSSNETELVTYFNELFEMFESHYSETDLDVSKKLERALKSDYGLQWALHILRLNKIIAFFDREKLSIVGFSADETREGVNCIKKHFVKARIKKYIKNESNFQSVDINFNKSRDVCYITGLPLDVIKAAYDIECE